MLIRNAGEADVDFLVDAILEADRSGTEVLSYCRIFDISKEELKKAIKIIVLENLGGFEMSLGCFRIAESEGKAIAAVSTWTEGMDGVSYGVKKLGTLSFVLPRKKQDEINRNLAVISELSIPRETGTLQIESVYTDYSFRGQGISGQLIDHCIKESKQFSPMLQKAQIQVMGENMNAIRAYQKIGFTIVEKRTSDNPEILRLLPGKTKLLLEKQLNN